MSQQTRVRRLAVLAAGAVASTSLAVVAVGLTTAPAGAAGTPSTFTWSFSEYIKRPAPSGQFAAPVVSDNATYDSSTGNVTFVAGAGRTDTRTHVTSVTYDGTASFSDSHGGTNYTIAFSDPTIAIDASGNGTLSADIAWAALNSSPGTAQDVQLTSFTADETTWNGAFALTAAPTWINEVAADAYGSGVPVDGKSWAQAFVTTLPSSVRAFFYASSSAASNEAKAPASFSAVLPGPKATATAETQSPTAVGVKVAGAGFTAVTNTGDAGVYVGLAPSGGLPDVSTQGAMSNFVTASYVTPAQIVDGAFTTTLSTTPDKLVSGASYSVYTWQAHSHSNTTQDTETPVTIDWAKLVAAPAPPTTPTPTVAADTKATAKVTKKLTTKKKGSLAVAITSADATPSGKITVALTKKGAKTIKRSATLKNGKATVKLPKLEAGTWKATVTYAGSGAFEEVTKVVTFKVEKAKKNKK